jgi:hypothetical protein
MITILRPRRIQRPVCGWPWRREDLPSSPLPPSGGSSVPESGPVPVSVSVYAGGSAPHVQPSAGPPYAQGRGPRPGLRLGRG